MPQKIIFENNVAKVIEERVLFECKTEDMMQQYLKHQPVKTKLLPRNSVYYERRQNNTSVFVIERSPQITRIQFAGTRGGESMALKLALPFVYFAVQVAEESDAVPGLIYPFCTTAPLRNLTDPIFILPLPNIYDEGNSSFCLGNISVAPTRDIKTRVENIIEKIMVSEWNRDLTFHLPDCVSDLKDWAKQTMEDPMIWRKMEYRQHRSKTLEGIVDVAFKEVR